MAKDDKKAKTEPAAKAADAPKDKTTPTTPEAVPPKPEAIAKADAAPSSYSRGEGQKPVTQAYKDNWNAIFAKPKPKTKKKKKTKR
jgi:hypothetical protein